MTAPAHTFPLALPEGFDTEELKTLVPADMWEKDSTEAAILALRRSGKFDEEAYLHAYPDVRESGMGAVEHYVRHGAGEERTLAVAEKCARPKVSVIVPVYNNAQYLHECIDSIISQTLKEIEIIIVNDGSTDPVAVEILNEYARKDSRIKLIHKKNTGYGHTMNIGIDNATGEYIGIVESDDYITKDMYYILYNTAKKNMLTVIKSNTEEFYVKNTNKINFVKFPFFKTKEKYNKKINPRTNKYIFNNMILNQTGIYLNMFIKNNKIKFNESPGASFQDIGFYFQVFCFADYVYFIDKYLYKLRRSNSESSIYSKEKVFCAPCEFAFVYSFLKKAAIDNIFIDVFIMRKFISYNFTLNRIDKQYKELFLSHIKEEFRQLNNKNQINFKLWEKKYINIYKEMFCSEDHINAKETVTFSIIIACFNAEKFINRCLDSVLAQTYKNFEIICIDDGSTDNTPHILNKYNNISPQIKIISQKNQGAGNARNNGLSIAKGKFLFFLDADDFIDKSLLQKSYNKLNNSKLDFIVFGSKGCNHSNGKEICLDWSINKKFIPSIKPFNIDDVKNNKFRVFNWWVWDKIYRSEFIKKYQVKFTEYFRAEDLYFGMLAYIFAKQIDIIEEQLITHTMENNTSASMTRDKYYETPLVTLKMIKQTMLKNCCFEKYEDDFIKWLIRYLLWFSSTLTNEYSKKLKDKFTKYYYTYFNINKIKNYEDYEHSFDKFKKHFMIN